MFIDSDAKKFLITENTSIDRALYQIEESKLRILVVTDQDSVVLGVVTNGDIIRWVRRADDKDKSLPISSLTNYGFHSLQENYEKPHLESLLIRFPHIPLLDEKGRLKAMAINKPNPTALKIGTRNIGIGSQTFVIAEIGNNHNGRIENAIELIQQAKKSGADAVKFQLRDMKSLYGPDSNKFNFKDDLNVQYTLDILHKFQFNQQIIYELLDYCKNIGIMPLCTPWDSTSLQALVDYGIDAIKIASADLTNHSFLHLCAKSQLPLILSTGMSTEKEISDAVNLLTNEKAKFAVLHCNSTYPAPLAEINLHYLKRLSNIHKGIIGYSGHERGIAVSIGAVALGAKIIERHITLDRNMEGPDHKASLLPSEFKELIKSIREIELALGSDSPRIPTQGELNNKLPLAKSIVAKRSIPRGRTIENSMLDIRSPGKGLAPYFKDQLIGLKTNRDIQKDDFFFKSDLEESSIEKKTFNFKEQWGIPVRLHDVKNLISESNLNIVEYHLSYKDITLKSSDFLTDRSDLDLIVHAPELFANDHIIDLSSPDNNYRLKSIENINKVIEFTKDLGRFYQTDTIPIITNVGGSSSNGFLSSSEKRIRYQFLAKSLKELAQPEIEILPQTMPPYPWHFGGQAYHNLFVHPEEIRDFCFKHELRICFDISHSFLACNKYNSSFYQFCQIVLPFTKHVHIADAKGEHGEGLEIGSGQIDFVLFFSLLKNMNISPSFIPEIWQGHQDNGKGFWQALQKLEEYYGKAK